jgi:tryptophan 2,3-dioxygenase
MLEEFMDPSAEWRMRKLAEALLDLGDKVGIFPCRHLKS